MTHKLFTGLLILIFGISGCSNLPNAGSEDTSVGGSVPRAWFDAPIPGTVFYPPNPCQVVAHGASPNGIALFELSINGVAAASIPSPDTQSSLATLTQDCGLNQPGEYLLQLRSQDNDGNWSGFAETSLIIAEGETPNEPPPATEVTVPVSPTATLIPTVEPTGGVSVERISTNLVYLGGSNCGTREVTITIRTTAPNGIKVVVLFYRFQTASSSSEFQSVGMKSISGNLYEATLNPTSLLGGSIPFDLATLQYQVVVQQNDGDTSIRTPVLADISVQACGSVSAACSSYANESSCIANGCSWVAIPAVVPSYECRNP